MTFEQILQTLEDYHNLLLKYSPDEESEEDYVGPHRKNGERETNEEDSGGDDQVF